MKKLVLIVVLLVSFAGMAQTQNEKNAKKVSDDMTTVMILSSDESKEVYDRVLKRNKEKQALKEEYGDNVEGFKVEGKNVEQQFNKDVRALVGNEKWKIWADYNKAKREAKANN
jgi:polyhydroxyalkanoate synthesis regulator phasin